jgi:hypothetical protein
MDMACTEVAASIKRIEKIETRRLCIRSYSVLEANTRYTHL